MTPPPCTFDDYRARWTRLQTVRPTTRAVYGIWLDRVWSPAFGQTLLVDVTRLDLLRALDRERLRGLKPSTLRCILGVVRALLADARDEGLVVENVATRLGRRLGRSEPRAAPMDRVELAHFLATAAVELPAFLLLFLTLARTGLRIGEALALQPRDVDLAARQLVVARTLRSDGTVGEPKTKHSRRRVDLSRQLTLALGPLVAEPGRDWLFGTRRGPLPYQRARRAFAVVRVAAGIRRDISLHSLRHSYASLLVARGVSPAYVQRALGHASIALTLDLYGRHLPMRDLAAVDALDDET